MQPSEYDRLTQLEVEEWIYAYNVLNSEDGGEKKTSESSAAVAESLTFSKKE